MRPPRRSRSRRLCRLIAMTARLSRLLELLSVTDNLDALQAIPAKHRSTLVPRQRRSFAKYIKPMLMDGSFSRRFRMGFDDFKTLVELLRPALKRNERMGALRNGTIPAEFQVAGGSIYEAMDGHVIARSTAYAIAFRVINALNACPDLDCRWQEGDDVAKVAQQFKNRSSSGVLKKCVRAGRVVHPHNEAHQARCHGAEHLLQRPQEGVRPELSG
ncbi:unnamed protein product, partial [Scytosiphon promiscuus]